MSSRREAEEESDRAASNEGDKESNVNGDQRQDQDAATVAAHLYRGVLLAPMVRASTTPLRTLALHYGADAVYTEELIDKSLLQTKRVVNSDLGTVDYVKSAQNQQQGKKRKKHKLPPVLLRIDPAVERGKLICQLGTASDVTAVQAAQTVAQDVAAVDVNMGCPKKFSLAGNMGAALLSDPDTASRIVRGLCNNLPSHMPVSAKIRLLPGKDGSSNNGSSVATTCEFIQALIESGGANAVAVHGRRVGDREQDAADWDTLQQVIQHSKQRFPSTQFLINGDFYTRREWTETMESCQADGVLLARPALYNTSLFRKPSLLAPDTASTPDFGYNSRLLLDKTQVVKEYIARAVRYQVAYQNTKYVVCEMMSNRRTPTERLRHLPQSFDRELTINSVCNCKSLDDVVRLWNVQPPASATKNDSAIAPTGEHRYDDAYILGRLNGDSSRTSVSGSMPANVLHSGTASLPTSLLQPVATPSDAKRPRIESSG